MTEIEIGEEIGQEIEIADVTAPGIDQEIETETEKGVDIEIGIVIDAVAEVEIVTVIDAVVVVEIATVGGDKKGKIAAEVGTKKAAAQAQKGIGVESAEAKMEHRRVHQKLRLNR